jgi:hypothetical protein
MVTMATIQTSDEIQTLLAPLEGQQIATLQVLGINSLKSMSPMPEALAGDVIESTNVQGRLFSITTTNHQVVFDLQRTGKIVWLPNAAPHVMTAGSARPTVRLVLADGKGLDLIEPAKTKRIAVTISIRS